MEKKERVGKKMHVRRMEKKKLKLRWKRKLHNRKLTIEGITRGNKFAIFPISHNSILLFFIFIIVVTIKLCSYCNRFSSICKYAELLRNTKYITTLLHTTIWSIIQDKDKGIKQREGVAVSSNAV